MNQIQVIIMSVIVLLCDRQVIMNCEETELCGKVKILSIPSVAIY
jgi:hypothetical protein